MSDSRPRVGYIVAGGIRDNLGASLEIPSETLPIGSYLMACGQEREFLTLVVDVKHPRFDPRLGGAQIPAAARDLLISQAAAPVAELQLLLTLEKAADWQVRIRPARELPALFTPVHLASAGDIDLVFNRGAADALWTIGTMRGQGYPIRVDLAKFVQRSSGIFGATGTGKSFLTRILLAGTLKLRQSAALVLDMHNEFGYDDAESDSGQLVPGLKTIAPERVIVAGLGSGTRIRGHEPDLEIQLSPSDIQPSDILLLREALNLTATAPTVLSRLVEIFGRQNWFSGFMGIGIQNANDPSEARQWGNKSVTAWAGKHGLHPGSAVALWRKLLRVYNRPYIVKGQHTNWLGAILPALQRGDLVVLSFGKYNSDLDYLLVANLLARRISSVWREQADRYRSDRKNKPIPLVIVVEEGHKFLNKKVASQTVFGDLARELRKSYCVVWVVDQRPSKIYDEVLSQLGTRISGWLGDEADIRAILTGLGGQDNLKSLLTSLEPRGEVLLAGWGAPIPAIVRTRPYTQMIQEEYPPENTGG